MNINFQFGKSPQGQEFFGVQIAMDPMLRVQTPPIDTRQLLRQIKTQQPEAFRDVHYEIVQANGTRPSVIEQA